MVLMALMMAVANTMNAQILIMDDEFEGTLRQETDEFVFVTPMDGSDIDQYLPLGDGLLALTGLGVAYLLGKRRKKDKSQ